MTKILLVEVDKKTLAALKEAVAGQGGYVISRCGAEEAEMVVKKEKPGIIFLNTCKMPCLRTK